eukprot:scaffold50891_cov63-Phaeocystis_antarctica.AAC.2
MLQTFHSAMGLKLALNGSDVILRMLTAESSMGGSAGWPGRVALQGGSAGWLGIYETHVRGAGRDGRVGANVGSTGGVGAARGSGWLVEEVSPPIGLSYLAQDGWSRNSRPLLWRLAFREVCNAREEVCAPQHVMVMANKGRAEAGKALEAARLAKVTRSKVRRSRVFHGCAPRRATTALGSPFEEEEEAREGFPPGCQKLHVIADNYQLAIDSQCASGSGA